MVEKRMSTRTRREPPQKKRALTPLASPTPPTPVKAVEVKDEPLPTRIFEGQPLPTVSKPQRSKLSAKRYQSISESGVLAASIERSRQKWIADGAFERYWEKPSKKKPLTGTSNPAKETMSRLGPCSLIIEPHVFEVTLYTVKELPTVPKAHVYQLPPPPQYSPYPQGPSYQAPVYSGPFTGTHNSNGPLQHPQPSPTHHTLPPFNEAFGRFNATTAPPPYVPPPPPPPTRSLPPVAPVVPRRSSSSNHAASPGKVTDPNSDPVIQILATRAASDHGLKSLMKVVASGQASPEQLKEFQNHIDEINGTLKNGKKSDQPPLRSSDASQKPPPPSSGPASRPEGPPSSSTPTAPPPSQPPRQPLPHTPQHSDPATVPIKTEPIYHSYYPPPPLPPPRPRPLPHHTPIKPEIHSIVFDIAGGNGDRFLFPRLSILDYTLGGTEVIVSFLVIRRGSAAATNAHRAGSEVGTKGSGKGGGGGANANAAGAGLGTTTSSGSRSSYYKDSKSYYQPVTVRLSAPNPRTLEPLARIVASPDEVRKHMENTFEKMLPAERVHLATRLPWVEGGEEEDEEEEGEEGGEGEESEDEVAEQEQKMVGETVRSWYEGPNSLVPLVV